MALSDNTIWECNASATALNVNGAGFNPSNTNFLTDGTVDTNTGNTASPVFSSASYNFVAGDVGHWLFVKSGTSTVPGYYQIASVASNKATLAASIGSGNIVNTTMGYPTPKWQASTVAGIATIGTPTSITFGVDYSRSTTAKVNGLSDFNAVGASTTLTSATAGFTPVMVGNIFHQTTTGTGAFGVVGWYEIATFVNSTTVTLDRTPNSGTASVNTTGYVGGAASLNSTIDDAFFEIMHGTNGTGGMRVFFKAGTFTFGQAVSVTTGIGGTTAPIIKEGYNTIRGDLPSGTSRPTINGGNFSNVFNSYTDFYHLSITGIAASAFATGTGNKIISCKIENSSTSAARGAYVPGGSNFSQNVECVSYRGIAVNYAPVNSQMNGCYIHDSDVNIAVGSANSTAIITNCLIVGAVTTNVNVTAALTGGLYLCNVTLYGAENKLGNGIATVTGASAVRLFNSIVYGMVTGANITDTQTVMYGSKNNFFNNTTDAVKWIQSSGTTTLDPQFAGVSQTTGTGGTSSTNVLTAGSGTPFGSLTSSDYLQIVSGTGTSFAANIYKVVSATSNTVTLSSNITSAGAGTNIVWQFTTGRNWGIGTNLAAMGFPGAFDSIATTGYLDLGAVQRQSTSASTVGYPFVS